MEKLTVILITMLFTASMVFAQSNNATVDQNGNGNDAEVEQTGTLNNADINQGFEGQGQNGADATISQSGVNNDAIINQRAWNNRGNEHSIEQIGTTNSAKVDAYNGDNVGTILQNGDDNDALMQHGAAKEGDGNIEQNGDENSALLRQYSGFGNSASIIQGVSNYSSNVNIANLKQIGNNNDAKFHLTWGDVNEVIIFQEGDNNYSEYTVKYGDGNNVTVNVLGDNNRSRFNVNAAWGSTSSDNSLDIQKTGDGNYLSGKLEGDMNEVNVIQNGNNNRIGTSWYTTDGINIAGNSNLVNVSQFSDSNSAFVNVSGDTNTATISQN